MATKIKVGSARSNENFQGKIGTGGKPGDQRQKKIPDMDGEVSMQEMYASSKGWIILRAYKVSDANALAERMETACNNVHIGYSQDERHKIWKDGIDTEKDTNCDCSSLVRQCIIEATGKDPGNIRTVDLVKMVMKLGIFENVGEWVSQTKTPLYNGDILCTKTSGHTMIVVAGNPRKKAKVEYFPQYIEKVDGKTNSIVDALNKLKINSSKIYRAEIAKVNGIKNYKYTAEQNLYMLDLLKQGKLIKP